MAFFDGIFVNIMEAAEAFLLGAGVPDYLVTFIDSVVYFVAIIAVCILVALVYVLWERKVAGTIQMRPGPNRLGPNGWFQTIADALKLLTKEDIVPRDADKIMHIAGPLMVFLPPVVSLSFIPFGNSMTAVDIPMGILFLLAFMSLSIFPTIFAGWGSNNKYSVIGAMRGVSQVISYEVPLIFSLMGTVMLAGSMNLNDMVLAQDKIWFVFLQPLGFIVFLITGLAETSRAPFDLPEGESELVSGVYTEYSGMKWALFFLGEYCSLFVISSLAVTVFLGGWHGPFLPGWLWFFIKVHLLYTFFIWIRWTFPRVRVDQLSVLGWKYLLPISLANVFLTGIVGLII